MEAFNLDDGRVFTGVYLIKPHQTVCFKQVHFILSKLYLRKLIVLKKFPTPKETFFSISPKLKI